jgi:catechol 2,3-dioxygenase-like lactoylglutathione lyase family enzyme
MIQSCRYVLAVPDLARSARYYRDVLGFEVREVGDPGWRFFTRDECFIMAGECVDAIPPGDLGDHSYFAYLVVKDVDAFHAEVVARGATILHGPPRSKPWGMREFALRTEDGHRMMIASELP